MTKNYILGGGVAGITFAYLNPTFKFFDRNPMGQLNSKYSLGPRLITLDDQTVDFFRKHGAGLGFPIQIISMAKVGYYDGVDVSATADEKFKRYYSLKTRGKKEYESTFLSAGETEIGHITFDDLGEHSYLGLFSRMLNVCRDRGQIIDKNVSHVDMQLRIITDEDGKRYSYWKLVNTLNLKVFQQMIDELLFGCDMKVEPKSFYVTERGENYLLDQMRKAGYSYVYSTCNSFDRVSFFDDYNVFERRVAFDKIDDPFMGCAVLKSFENIPIQIVNSIDMKRVNHIRNLGRYAQWKHGVKFNDVLKEAHDIMRAWL
jgi:hypothetical protein